MKRLILYDLDGTLVDTGEDIAHAANHMLQQLQAATLSEAEVRRYVGRGLHDLVQRCLKTDDRRLIEEGTKLFYAYYEQHLLDHSVLYPGVREALDYFEKRGQAIITNKPEQFSRQLVAGLGIADYFLEVIGSDSRYPKKPHPAGVQAIMAKAAVGPDDTLLVGDSPIDVQTGRRAGIPTVILAQGYADPEELAASAPDIMVRNFHQFLALAKQQGW